MEQEGQRVRKGEKRCLDHALSTMSYQGVPSRHGNAYRIGGSDGNEKFGAT